MKAHLEKFHINRRLFREILNTGKYRLITSQQSIQLFRNNKIHFFIWSA